MRISNHFVLSILAIALGAVVASTASIAKTRYADPKEAERNGISAYKGGYYELAIPALEYAAERNMFLAQYFLARLYADNNSAHTDHAKAFLLFRSIAHENADADPDDESRAPYVARAFTALAQYYRLGLNEANVDKNLQRAAEYLNHAALFFSDPDAQFELAKLYLKGDGGVPLDIPHGKHWLSRLAQEGHAGAQAFLSDLLWKGKIVEKDEVMAYALISVAVKNAPTQDRVWIEDIYQNIHCGASPDVRKQVDGGMVADWDRRYGREPEYEDRSGLGQLDAAPVRTCANGEAVPIPNRRSMGLSPEEELAGEPGATVRRDGRQFLRGSMGVNGGLGGRLRSVGSSEAEANR